MAASVPKVAPHAGARIETNVEAVRVQLRIVAPHASARIETLIVP